jgi:hypothetical protein
VDFGEAQSMMVGLNYLPSLLFDMSPDSGNGLMAQSLQYHIYG